MKTYLQKSLEEAKLVGRGLKKLRSFKFAYTGEVLNRFNRKESIIFLGLVLILVADLVFSAAHFYVAHTIAVPAYGGSYTEGLVGQPRYINPLLAQTQTDKDISRLVYAGLYKVDGSGKMIPDLADSDLKISSDGKQYTVDLKQNLKWQDGEPLNADDIVFTVQLLQNQDYKSPYRGNWQNIQVQKVNDYEVRFTSPSVSAPFISNLTLGILPQHIWKNISGSDFAFSKYNLEPVGSGPYITKEINKLSSGDISSITLESYSNYWAGRPNIDNIILKFYHNYEDTIFALQTKDVQGLGFIPFDKKVFVDEQHTKQNVYNIPVFEYQATFFNLNKSSQVLGDRIVRQALAQSLDRTAFINNVYSGLALPAYGPILPGQLGYDPAIETANPFNLDQANSALDKAGWIRDPSTGIRSKGKTQLAFTITTSDFSLNAKSADELKAQWQKIGANININIVASQDIEKNVIRPRNFDALIFSESTGYDPDPFVFWHSSQSKDPGFNLAQYKNSTVDKLITEARSTIDTSTRETKYKSIQEIMEQDLPAIFLSQSEFVYEVNPQVKGINIDRLANPEDRFYDVTHWYIQTRRVWKK